MTIDVDSTICEVSAKTKAGAAYGHTQQLGYHPLIATRAETGETLHTRLRKGSSQRGNVHFIAETVARARRAGAAGQLTVRADSGFWSNELIDRLDAAKVRWSVTIPLYGHVKAAIGAIDEDDWEPIPYRDGGDAQVAETTIIAGGRDNRRDVRLVVRRTRLTDSAQAALWPDWRHHALVTNRDDLNSAAGDAYHRQHATVELAIRDLKGEHRTGAPAVGELLRQRRLADLRRTGPQPLPLDHHTRRNPPHGTSARRANRPQPTPRCARAPRQPRRTPRPAPPRPLALGNHLPHHPHQHPRPAPTLLSPHQNTHRPGALARPHAPQHAPTRPEPPQRPLTGAPHRHRRPQPTPHNPNRPKNHPNTTPHQPESVDSGLDGQVESESVVELRHEINRNETDQVADPFDGYRSDLFGLRFGVPVESCFGGIQQHLERVDPFRVRGDGDNRDRVRAVPRSCWRRRC